MNAVKKTLAGSLSRWLERPAPAPASPSSVVPPGFTSLTEWDERDVFIVGYPKSGNTWFQDLAAGVVFGALPELAPPAMVLDLVPDVHMGSWYKRYATPMFFKSHALPCPAYRQVVYLLRDGRDAMVSYHHHLSALEGRPVDFLQTVKTGEGLFPCKWPAHVRAWMANPFQARMLTIKYEDLKRDTTRELERFCEFCGLKRSTAFLRTIAESAVFEKMRDKERTQGLGDPQWPKEKDFRRRGAVGSHADEMPAAVRDAFMQEAGETLRQFGYV